MEGQTGRTSESETLEQRLQQIRGRIAILAKELEWRNHRPKSWREQMKDQVPDLAYAAARRLFSAPSPA